MSPPSGRVWGRGRDNGLSLKFSNRSRQVGCNKTDSETDFREELFVSSREYRWRRSRAGVSTPTPRGRWTWGCLNPPPPGPLCPASEVGGFRHFEIGFCPIEFWSFRSSFGLPFYKIFFEVVVSFFVSSSLLVNCSTFHAFFIPFW